MLGLTAFAVSFDESRYILNGILFQISKNNLVMVHRLARPGPEKATLTPCSCRAVRRSSPRRAPRPPRGEGRRRRFAGARYRSSGPVRRIRFRPRGGLAGRDGVHRHRQAVAVRGRDDRSIAAQGRRREVRPTPSARPRSVGPTCRPASSRGSPRSLHRVDAAPVAAWRGLPGRISAGFAGSGRCP